jgi:hypothetical protein
MDMDRFEYIALDMNGLMSVALVHGPPLDIHRSALICQDLVEIRLLGLMVSRLAGRSRDLMIFLFFLILNFRTVQVVG